MFSVKIKEKVKTHLNKINSIIEKYAGSHKLRIASFFVAPLMILLAIEIEMLLK